MSAALYLVGYRDEDGKPATDWVGGFFNRPDGDKDVLLAREQFPDRDWMLLEVRAVPGQPVDLPDVVKRVQELAGELGDWADTRVLEAPAAGDSTVPLLLVRVAAWLDLASRSYARIQDAGEADVPAELVHVLDAIPAVTR
ncbi:MAG TPA: hypothetical protein VFM55_19170 [Micromonosporaceae bacterium]|nr:hypothetical protein [Micromonosporaceae bacterium]